MSEDWGRELAPAAGKREPTLYTESKSIPDPTPFWGRNMNYHPIMAGAVACSALRGKVERIVGGACLCSLGGF